MDPISVPVALTGVGLSTVNSLNPLEERRIVFAMGKQFRNGDPGIPFQVPHAFRLSGDERIKKAPRLVDIAPKIKLLPAIPLTDGPNGTLQYFNAKQGVRFTIEVINTKNDYIKAMQTPGVHLIYTGHARYGRGPCFGSGGSSKGEEWEEGHSAHPNADGIFRMGFPYVPSPVGDIVHHGYTANLARSSVRFSSADCDPDLRARLGALTAHTIDEIASIAIKTAEFSREPALSNLTKADVRDALLSQVRNSDPSAHYWTFRDSEGINIIHVAGWENTLSAPDDLGAETPTCRVFCHFGCTTFRHNYVVMRKYKPWVHLGDDRFAYWTTNLSYFTTSFYWLYAILSYDQFNANQSWNRSLNYAVQKTNAWLTYDGLKVRVI